MRSQSAGSGPITFACGLSRYGQRTTGGMDERIDWMLPPVFKPKMVPRS